MGSFSRRDFLKGGAAVAAGSALAGAFAVTSYADDATAADAAATGDDAAAGEASSSSMDVEQAVEQALASARVHETDVLVLGGGLAGMEAALRAVELGCTATIVDKGVFGHSGTSGINWGHTYQSAELSDDDTTVGTIIASMAMVCGGLINQPYFYNLIKAQYEEKPIATALKYGSIPLYNKDGTVLSGYEPYEAYPLVMDQGFWPRMMAQWRRRDGHVTEIVENTYVLDMLYDVNGVTWEDMLAPERFGLYAPPQLGEHTFEPLVGLSIVCDLIAASQPCPPGLVSLRLRDGSGLLAKNAS